MAEENLDSTVQSILPLIKYHFIGEASNHYGEDVEDITYTATSTSQKRGASGRVLISEVWYECKFGELSASIAMKFFDNKESAMRELRNAMELDIKFRTAPEFGIPRVIFSSTQNPTLIIYEGVIGTNYDEIQHESKANEAGRLLATIHGADSRPVNMEIYQNLTRMLGSQLSVLGREKEISNLLSLHFERMKDAMSGTNPFSDYHQSNVMLSMYDQQILKAYVIDPEFMQKGSFDRMEDVGTFFGSQALDEYLNVGTISNTLNDLNQFLEGYENKLRELQGYRLKEMYPYGNPIGFFIAQWALMDALDLALNRGGNLKSDEVQNRVDFVIFILKDVNFEFPTK